ncbi:MAG: hypothetical protein Phog2KO_11280 [Phototrophicaceae bacterium]
MKKLTPIVQRPQDLILAYVVSDILPETQILVQHIWHYQDWQARFAIIGESHRVSLSYQGNFIMEEMLACIVIPLDSCQYYHPLSDLRPHYYQQNDYSVQLDINNPVDKWQKSEQEISFTFPAINGKEALTKLQWQATQTSIQWHSLHTYTNEGELLCVYSKSHYNFQLEE